MIMGWLFAILAAQHNDDCDSMYMGHDFTEKEARINKIRAIIDVIAWALTSILAIGTNVFMNRVYFDWPMEEYELHREFMEYAETLPFHEYWMTITFLAMSISCIMTITTAIWLYVYGEPIFGVYEESEDDE